VGFIAQLQTGRVMFRTRDPAELLRERIGNTWPGGGRASPLAWLWRPYVIAFRNELPSVGSGLGSTEKQPKFGGLEPTE
jgi:hypothetical protein